MSGLNLQQIAAVAHDANRRLQILQGDPAPSPEWLDAPDWQRESAIDGVQAAIDGATPRQLHESWCAFKVADGWTFGPVKDADAKTHPCLVDYDDLPSEQRLKDALFAAIVQALTAD